jgi:tRNA pseudouridine38-40 synthase
LKYILLKIQYRGARYQGWQKQAGPALTVQGEFEKVLQTIFNKNLSIRVSSRTDSGVDAEDQIACLKVPASCDEKKLFFSLNSMLPDDISVLEIAELPEYYEFRKIIKGKRYKYRALNSPINSALHYDKSWWIKKKIDYSLLQKALDLLKGQHDFSAFGAKGTIGINPLQTITKLDLQVSNDGIFNHLLFTIEGTAFLRKMIRIMIGTVVDIGVGRLPLETIEAALKSGKRSDAGKTAPAHGLRLEKVFLNPDPFSHKIKII